MFGPLQKQRHSFHCTASNSREVGADTGQDHAAALLCRLETVARAVDEGHERAGRRRRRSEVGVALLLDFTAAQPFRAIIRHHLSS